MGKKKRKVGGEAGPSSKARKLEPTLVKYEEIPFDHKKKLIINDDRGTDLRYAEILCWLKFMGCKEGTVFGEIENLNWVTGCPLVEVEVAYDDVWAKFLIAKMTLYIVGFITMDGQKFHFNRLCGFVVEGFTELKEYDGRYTTQPWVNVGPMHMIKAIKDISDILSSVKSKVEACETFYVHLAEATRLYPIRNLVLRSLVPTTGRFDRFSYADEMAVELVGEDGRTISHGDDVYHTIKARGPIDIGASIASPAFTGTLIKSFSNMSKYWFVYALTEKKVFSMRPNHVTKLHMRNIKSLRCTLSVLGNVNLEKIVSEWEGKLGKRECPSTFTTADLVNMKQKVEALQEQKKVFVPNQ